MPAAFDTATTTTKLAPGRYRAPVSDAWNIGANPNGGYVLALVANIVERVARA